jgi:flavodoxin
MTNKLVTYFSASGQTKKVAELIADALDADIEEIVPEEKYTSADLNWHDQNSRSSVEMNDKSSRPKIASTIDVSNYDTIIIGFPIWWYTAPTIINTFMEESNVKDKNIYVFATSGSTGVNGSFDDLKNAYPDNNWVSAKRLTSSDNSSKITDWINE